MSKAWIAVLHLGIGLFFGGAAGFYFGVRAAGKSIGARARRLGLERELTKFMALTEE